MTVQRSVHEVATSLTDDHGVNSCSLLKARERIRRLPIQLACWELPGGVRDAVPVFLLIDMQVDRLVAIGTHMLFLQLCMLRGLAMCTILISNGC